MYRLVITDAARGVRREIALSTAAVSLGAAADNDIVVAGDRVASHHCRVEPIAGGFKLADLHTDHGTRVNGEFVAQKRLAPGDRIELGALVIEFALDPKAATARPTPPAAPAPARPVAPPPPRPAVARAPSAAPGDAEPIEVLEPLEASRPRAARPMHRLVLAVVLVGAVLGVAIAAPRFLPRRGEDTFLRDRFALAETWRDAGRYDDARRVLEALRADAPDERGTIDRELSELAKLEDHARQAREGLEAVRALRATLPDDARRRLEDLAGRFASIPRIGGEIADLRLELAPARSAPATAAPKRPDFDALRARTDGFADQKNFSGALAAWRALSELDNDIDRAIRDNEIAVLDARAIADAKRILARVDDLIAKHRTMAALVMIDEVEMTGYRGSDAFRMLDSRETELQAQMGTTLPNGELPNAPSVLHRPTADGAARATPNSEPTAAKIDPAVAKAIAAGDELFHRGDLDGARKLFAAALSADLDAGQRDRLQRRIDRSTQAQRLLDRVATEVRANPSMLDGVQFSDRSGERAGPARNVTSGGEVMMSTGSGQVEGVPLAEIAGATIVTLARKCKLTAEDQLALANFALVDGLTADADAALAIAQKDPTLKTGVDSAVAFLRDLPEIPEWGFFRVDDRWLTFREREQSQNVEGVAKAAQLLDKGDDKQYRQGLDDLVALMPVAHDAVVAVLLKRRAAQIAALKQLPELTMLDALALTKQKLDEKRSAALALIFDEKKYFYPYRPPEVSADRANLYPKVQHEVDDLVQAVRDVWGDEFGEAPKHGVALSAKLRRGMHQLDAEGALLSSEPPGVVPDEPLVAKLALLPHDAPSVDIRNVATTLSERAQLDHDVVVMAENAAYKGDAINEEIENVRITNLYRMMMGRAALRLNDKLVKSSRGHSKWMSALGRLEHVEDRPERKTPMDRVKLEGISPNGVGENCAISSGAMAAHQAWCESSGHHRNLLDARHSEMGAAFVGRFWTQNFIGGTDNTKAGEDG